MKYRIDPRLAQFPVRTRFGEEVLLRRGNSTIGCKGILGNFIIATIVRVENWRLKNILFILDIGYTNFSYFVLSIHDSFQCNYCFCNYNVLKFIFLSS